MQRKNKKVENRGGVRLGSGQKKKYGEETTTVAFRCPVSKVPELKNIVHLKLLEWSKAMKELNLANKKMAKLLKRNYVEPKPMYIYIPIFDNIAQVKKMVDNLTAK